MSKRMKRVYLCHEFGGIYDNSKKITENINVLISYNKKSVYISPILLFGHLYDKVKYSLYIDYCLSELKTCDIMITFGEDSYSKECMIEKEFCKTHNIPIVDYIDYCKRYRKG